MPNICAKQHNNKHIVKMPLETAQILCSVHHVTESEYIPRYKLCHKNHPCNKWARENLSNYLWLVDLGLELCKEYTFRYGREHASQKVIEDLKNNLPDIPEGEMTPFAQAMPETYKDSNAVDAYRLYYYFEKHHLADWKNRDKPDWWKDYENLIF